MQAHLKILIRVHFVNHPDNSGEPDPPSPSVSFSLDTQLAKTTPTSIPVFSQQLVKPGKASGRKFAN